MQRHHYAGSVFAILVFCVALFNAAPSAGQLYTGQQGFSSCARLPDRLVPQDAGWIRARLGEVFSAEHAKLLAGITIEEDKGDTLLGPEITGTTLRLPRTFLKRLCHQILMQSEFAQRFETDIPLSGADQAEIQAEANSIVRQVRQCNAGGSTKPSCLNDGVLRYLQTHRIVSDSFSQDPDGESHIVLAYGAAEFLIAHEAAHLVIDKTYSDEKLGRLTPFTEEAEADLIAQHHLFGQQKLPVGPIMAMATMSLSESDIAATNRSHPSAICRYHQFRWVFENSAPTYFRVLSFFSESMDTDDEANFENYVQSVLQRPMLTGPSQQSLCDTSSNRYVLAAVLEINQFFDPLLSTLAAANMNSFADMKNDGRSASADDRKKIEQIMATAMNRYKKTKWQFKTSKKLAAQNLGFLTSIFSAVDFFDEETADQGDDEINARDIAKQLHSTTKASIKLYREFNLQDLSREDRMLSEYGEAAFELMRSISNRTTAKSYFSKHNAIVDDIMTKYKFDFIEYFDRHKYFSDLSPTLLSAYFPRYSSFYQIAEMYAQGQLMSGDCASPAFREKSLAGRMRKKIPGAEPFDQQECEHAKSEIQYSNGDE